MAWDNISKNSSTFSNQSKSDPLLSKQLLMIDGTYFLLIDATYKLEIQSAGIATTWANKTKN